MDYGGSSLNQVSQKYANYIYILSFKTIISSLRIILQNTLLVEQSSSSFLPFGVYVLHTREPRVFSLCNLGSIAEQCRLAHIM